MVKNIIASIVAAVFGVVILVTGICTGADAVIIVFGALLLAAGVACLVMSFFVKEKEQLYIDLIENENNELSEENAKLRNALASKSTEETPKAAKKAKNVVKD